MEYFSKALQQTCKDLKGRVMLGKASLIIIDGFMGEGKTTLATHVADYFNMLDGFPPIKFEEQLGQGGENFQEKLRVCYQRKLPTVIYDEAGDFNKRGAMTKFNSLLNRTFETYRAFRIIPILCLPSCESLDKEIYNKGIPRLLINVYDRNQNYGNFRAWGYRDMGYLRAKMAKLVIKAQAYNMQIPNFYGHFYNLPEERRKELEKVTIGNKLELLRSSEIQAKGLYDFTMLSNKVGRSKRYVKEIIAKKGIQSKELIQHKKYFDEQALIKLQAIFNQNKGRQ